nr:MAG TPA: hypothetical protein [Caudoviricetes sp.]
MRSGAGRKRCRNGETGMSRAEAVPDGKAGRDE